MKTLVIDDDASSRNIFKISMEKFGECHLASTGVKGIEKFKNAFISGNSYDLVVVDIILPDMNGNEILKIIRTEEDMCKISDFFRTKVIMTTSLDDDENRELAASLTFGMEAYYPKAFANDGLMEKLKELGLPKY